MSQSSANGFELMGIFISAIDQHYGAALLSDPSLSGMPGEALLQAMLDRYQPQCSSDIRRAVCRFLRSMGRMLSEN
jgi:hypothetical protein